MCEAHIGVIGQRIYRYVGQFFWMLDELEEMITLLAVVVAVFRQCLDPAFLVHSLEQQENLVVCSAKALTWPTEHEAVYLPAHRAITGKARARDPIVPDGPLQIGKAVRVLDRLDPSRSRTQSAWPPSLASSWSVSTH